MRSDDIITRRRPVALLEQEPQLSRSGQTRWIGCVPEPERKRRSKARSGRAEGKANHSPGTTYPEQLDRRARQLCFRQAWPNPETTAPASTCIRPRPAPCRIGTGMLGWAGLATTRWVSIAIPIPIPILLEPPSRQRKENSLIRY